MNGMSFLFFGMMLVPFIIFLIWLVKQDKKRDYMGLALLLAAIIVAVIVAVYADAKYMKIQ